MREKNEGDICHIKLSMRTMKEGKNANEIALNMSRGRISDKASIRQDKLDMLPYD